MVKVDNAIIIAAGFGTRFVPVSFSKPKGLVEVFGEPMVERQIKQLHEVGIKEIVIVTGYKGAEFEYLKEKYGVILIDNPDFNTKNNISSIYYAREYFKNSYLLTSDIYMPSNIYNDVEPHSWYALRYFEGESGEWQCHLDTNDKIVAVDYQVKDGWAMYGPAFLTASFSKKLIDKITDIYQDESKSNYYWENVYIDNIEEMSLYANKLADDVIIEFDDFEALRDYDSVYKINAVHESIAEIATTFNVAYDEIYGFEPIDIGMTNKSFKFKVHDVTYVYRLAGEGTDVLISRLNEYTAYQAIEGLQISDEIINFNPQAGSKITRFFENARTLDKNNWDEVAEAMKIIKQLHKQKIQVDHEFNLIERIGHYKSLCESVHAEYYDGLKQFDELIMKLADETYSTLGEATLCHIDPVYMNLIYTDEGLKLLDWEYAGMAYPLLDVAMHGLYAEYNEIDMDRLLALYLERTPSADERNLYYTFISLSGYLWVYWTIFKEYSGLDFGSYGMDQFKLSKKYYNKVKMSNY